MLESCLIEYYPQVRSGLFISGFTVASFLFSMKSTIIKTLKDDIYEHEKFIDKSCESIALDKSDDGFYGRLKKFSTLIYLSISLSFLSAISQFTVGFIAASWAYFICLLLAFISWVVLGYTLYLVHENWTTLLDFEEALKREKYEKKINSMKSKDNF